MLQLQAGKYSVVMDNDPTYTPGSADNNHDYQYVFPLGEMEYQPSSRHSLRVWEEDAQVSSCVLLAGGGASGVHEHSALVHEASCVVAVGPFLCSLALPSLRIEWQMQVDWATCFGVYHSEKHECYITWGEMVVARVSYSGGLVWETGGKDIFVQQFPVMDGPDVLKQGFKLHEEYVEVADWSNEVYRITVSSGISHLVLG